MTTLTDLKKSINAVLDNNFPEVEIYSRDTKEGFKRPVFFTQLVPITTEYETVNFTSNRVMVVITYFSEKGTELENLEMHDDIKKTFGMTLKVGQRFLLLRNIKSEIIDEVLQFRFDLDFFVDIEKVDNHELMEELHTEMINIEGKG